VDHRALPAGEVPEVREGSAQESAAMKIVKAVAMQSGGDSYQVPSTWWAWTETGEPLFMKYHLGRARVWRRFGSSSPKLLAFVRHGSALDSRIELDEFCNILGLQLEIP
jgi:hypothetical protein